MKELTDSNFFLYAAANYNNSNCYDTKEFIDDLNLITYLKRLFSRYLIKGDLNERIILNHLITIYNVFEVEAATRILFLKIEEKYWSYLKTFLLFLNFMPECVQKVNNKDILSDMIPVNLKIANVLRNI